MGKLNHVMIDLETMSSNSDAVIASIGAVYFDLDTGEMGDEFYAKVDLSKQDGRRRFSGLTVAWWLQQPDEARKALAREGEGLTPTEVCKYFTGFYKRHKARHLWSHATFDAVVLRSFYEEFSKDAPTSRYGKAPWHYREARDIRTLNAIAHSLGYKVSPDEGSTDRVVIDDLIPHNALGDAKRQAIYVSEMYKFIKNVRKEQ